MPKGTVLRKDDTTKEALRIKGEKDLDRGMLKAMTGEDGPLQAGALPSVKAQSIAGVQKVMQALDDDKGQVTKAPKKRKEKEPEGDSVEPKTLVQSDPQFFFQGGTAPNNRFQRLVHSKDDAKVYISVCSS